MGSAFLLFVMLARQSEVQAGVFRLIVTYLVISELIGLLGTQRWLVVEIGQKVSNRGQLFLAGSALALLTAVLLILGYVGISFSGLYGDEISGGLQLAALAAIPAALLTNVQTALLALGLSQRMGLLNLVESLVRSTIGIVCVWAGSGALSIILVFVVCRWATTLFGLVMVVRRLDMVDWYPRREFVYGLMRHVPQFVVITLAFLLMRNAALLLLPILVDEREAAMFAVPYQFYDIALLVPTMLALSSNFLFIRRAVRGSRALRWTISQLWSLTALFLLPLVMLSLVFGADLLLAIFGQRYAASVPAFYLLMSGVLMAALDQVLSQTMQATRRFREDAISTLCGASVALLGTILLGVRWGATGAAWAFLITLMTVLFVRFLMLRKIISVRHMLRLLVRPLIVVFVIGLILEVVRYWIARQMPMWISWCWLPLSMWALLVYWSMLQRGVVIKHCKRGRVRQFLSIRYEAKQLALAGG